MKAELKPEELKKNYIISEDGSVFSKLTNKFLKQDTSTTGYATVVLSEKGNKRRFLVHRLIAEAFIPNPENKPCVNHKDGNKLNNSIPNLEWVTYSENERHSHYVLGKRIIHSAEAKLKMKAKAVGRSMKAAVKASVMARLGKPALNCRKVILNGITAYDSVTLAAKATGLSLAAIIQNIKGQSKITKVGLWTYAN